MASVNLKMAMRSSVGMSLMCVLTDDEHETFKEVVQMLADKAQDAKDIRGAVSVHSVC